MSTPMSRHYKSKSAYQFRKADSDTIARVVSYHRKDFSRSVIWFPPREHDIIRSSISTPFPRAASTGHGRLGRLPLELWHGVLLHLDMLSLFRLRQTNGNIRRIVDFTSQYQLIVAHGMNLLCALLRTRLADQISLLDFYQILCTKDCAFCGEFAIFVSLLRWQKCCYTCLQWHQDLDIQTGTAVQKALHLSAKQLSKLRSLKSLPGIYSMDETEYKSRVTLVSVHEAGSMFENQPGASLKARFVDSTRSRKLNFMASCALPYYHKGTGKVEHGVCCVGCQYALENDVIGYTQEDWAFDARERAYSQDGFLAHFRWCKQGQHLWEISNNGKITPSGLPKVVRRGGFFNERT